NSEADFGGVGSLTMQIVRENGTTGGAVQASNDGASLAGARDPGDAYSGGVNAGPTRVALWAGDTSRSSSHGAIYLNRSGTEIAGGDVGVRGLGEISLHGGAGGNGHSLSIGPNGVDVWARNV